MPSLYYVGDLGRYYPSLGLEPEHGVAYNLDENPNDGRWDTTPTGPGITAPEPESAPATDADTDTTSTTSTGA